MVVLQAKDNQLIAQSEVHPIYCLGQLVTFQHLLPPCDKSTIFFHVHAEILITVDRSLIQLKNQSNHIRLLSSKQS